MICHLLNRKATMKMSEAKTVPAKSVSFESNSVSFQHEQPRMYSTASVGFDAVKHLLTNRPIVRRKVTRPIDHNRPV